ncbi:MAG: Hsp20/alpha crystallin family protein [Bacteriovoracia bacterium]
MFGALALRKNHWLDNPFDALFSDEVFNDVAVLRPAVDLTEEKDRYLLRADLPGVAEKDLKVEFSDGQLVIEGKREAATKREGASLISERAYSRFRRAFELGEGVNAEKIEATYQDGTLTLSIPKSERALPKVIPITVKK